MSTPPSLPERPRPSATLHFTRANGDRRSLVLEARDSRSLDGMIVDRIGDIRAAGNRMVKTDLTIDGEQWTYEYDGTGHVERIFRNGEVTP